MNKKTSISDSFSYRNFCKIASIDDSIFQNFKTNNEYTKILEHVSYSDGELYSKWCLQNKNFNLEKLYIAKLNDLLGRPIIENYPEPIGKISPSSLRYLKVLLELESLFGDLNDKNIVEIGVGYGGQCKLIKNSFKIKSYTLIDLEEPLELAKKYLNDDSLKFFTIDQLDNLLNYDLVISNYAFSECDRDIQLKYIDTILNNSKSGYITYNNISHIFNVSSMSKEELKNFINFKEIDEYPLTFNENKILVWGLL